MVPKQDVEIEEEVGEQAGDEGGHREGDLVGRGEDDAYERLGFFSNDLALGPFSRMLHTQHQQLSLRRAELIGIQ